MSKERGPYQESFARAVRTLARDGEWDRLQAPAHLLGMAQYLAEPRRFGRPGPDIRRTIDRFAEPARQTVVSLADFYAQLPELTGDREHDLGVLEASVQEVARAMHAPFVPRLIQEEGRDAWDIGEF